jgi:DNA-3-methyladenine glycosylase I
MQMHKRSAYRGAFHDFRIDACAVMTDEELEGQRSTPGIIRNKNKIYSVRNNARIVQQIQKEFGSFDAYLWSFTGREYGPQKVMPELRCSG